MAKISRVGNKSLLIHVLLKQHARMQQKWQSWLDLLKIAFTVVSTTIFQDHQFSKILKQNLNNFNEIQFPKKFVGMLKKKKKSRI